jgi:hypothetical protein
MHPLASLAVQDDVMFMAATAVAAMIFYKGF